MGLLLQVSGFLIREELLLRPTGNARFRAKGPLGEEAQRFAAASGLDDLARIACALGGIEAFDESCPGPAHQEVGDRDVSHLALDDE